MLIKKIPPVKYANVDTSALIDFANNDHIDITDPAYGAQSGVAADQGPAIMAALADGQVTGMPVYGPAGEYQLDTPLTISQGVTFYGAGWGTVVPGRGTRFRVVNNATMRANPAITIAGDGVRLRDFAIYHDQPPAAGGWVPTDYTWAISCVAPPGSLSNDIVIDNIYLKSATRGIRLGDAANSLACGRILIRNINGQVFRTGIQAEYILDKVRIAHVHFWPFWSGDVNVQNYTLANTIGLVCQRADNLVVHDFFSILHRIGFYFTSNAHGFTQRLKATSVDLDGIGEAGVYVDADYTTALFANLSINSLTGQGDTNAIVIGADEADLQVANFYGSGMGRSFLYVDGSSRVDIANFVGNIWSQEAASAWPGINVVTSTALVRLSNARFGRSYPGFATPAAALDVGGLGTVQDPGYRAFTHVRNSVAVSIPHNVLTAIPFDTQIANLDALHSVGVNPSRITIKRPGRYHLSGFAGFAYQTAGVRFLSIVKNGGAFMAGASTIGAYTSAAALPAFLTHATEARLNAGEYVELFAYQDTGGPIDIIAEVGRSPELIVSYIGD